MDISRTTETGHQRFRDFGLVAALVTKDFVIQKTEKDFKHVFFIFEDSSALQDAVSQYWANKLFVSARQYFDNTKMLKSRIYSEDTSYAS